MTGPGDLTSLNQGEGEQKSAFEQAAGRGSSWVDAAQGLSDATSPPEWGAATFSARAEAVQSLMNPGQALMDNGLGFLVSIVLTPLTELAEFAIGDPEQMRATGEGWHNVATWLDKVAEQEAQRAEATAESWVGEAGDAFRAQMTEFGEGVRALAEDVRGLEETLEMIADVFDMFVEFVIQIITELIIGLIVQWLAALAASWATAGASVATAGATTTVQVGATGVRITMRISKIQMQLAKLLRRFEDLLKQLREAGRLRRVIDRMNELRNGNAVSRFAARRLDSNAVFSTVTRAGEDFASTTANRFMRGIDGSQALAGNLAQRFLADTLGGQMRLSGAIYDAGTSTAADAAIEQGSEAAYDEGEDRTSGMTEQQRRAAQEEGFA